MAKSQISHAEFEDLLIRALKRLGAIVIPRFRIPGTDLRLDLYIAFPVRAFVEINLRDPPNSTDLNQLRQQLTLYRNQFADEIVPILVMSDKSDRILDPKCDIVFTPDVILGAGEAMRRRESIAFVGSTAAAWPLVAHAQKPGIGVPSVGDTLACFG